ncbi:MAG: acetate--CoA ligase family protein [Pseudomonadota bacterium]
MTLIDWIEEAVRKGKSALNEYEAKSFLEGFGIPVNRETFVPDIEMAVKAALELGYPVVLKATGERLQHKTELGAVALHLKSEGEVRAEGQRLLAIAGTEGLLVQEMVIGDRELVCGLTRDAQFGPCVMFGVGGIFTELIDDVVFRVAPITMADAACMMHDIRMAKILEAFRGQSTADREALARILVAVGEIRSRFEAIREIDINPIKIRPDGSPVAVDALVAIREKSFRP